MKHTRLHRIAMGLLLAAASLAGCENAGKVTGGDQQLARGEESPEFLDRVSSQQYVSENDALRGILLLSEGEDTAGGFGDRVVRLKAKDIVAGYWDFQADRHLTKGKLAYMVYQAADVPGGVTLTVFGPTERYCLRELQYRGMISDGTWYSPVSGMEFIAVLTRADTFMQTGEVPEIIQVSGSR